MSTSDPTRPGPEKGGRDPENVRIGDAERNAAVDALGEHMTTGRLDLDEYGTRSALANAARTVGELHALFVDLPAPHPVLPGDDDAVPARRRAPGEPGVVTAAELQAIADDRSRVQKLVGAAAASSGVIALVLFFVTGQWWWFLLVPLISTIAGSLWGDGWKRP